ncbi:hypothetical protein RHCRD62_30372 [Rhodococcus sp. RD6.2]|uniref:hypothetical protein n=1 Tax=Rhodococcus sp. RD6.2 TaxID=260936 RepID=UPI00063B4215|nr:hypothetical protein [Rhodococcus sp. RD6.2]CRK51708.1 hypothetical protein RHCRD62_30372 [Rhodococcus sp. RD6.2]
MSAAGPNTTSEQPAGFGCAGTDRVTPGAEVTVRDSAGSTLAVSRLDSSTVLGGGCTFTFSVAGVPRGHDHYQVTVGRLGGVTVSAEQAEAGVLLLVAA